MASRKSITDESPEIPVRRGTRDRKNRLNFGSQISDPDTSIEVSAKKRKRSTKTDPDFNYSTEDESDGGASNLFDSSKKEKSKRNQIVVVENMGRFPLDIQYESFSTALHVSSNLWSTPELFKFQLWPCFIQFAKKVKSNPYHATAEEISEFLSIMREVKDAESDEARENAMLENAELFANKSLTARQIRNAGNFSEDGKPRLSKTSQTWIQTFSKENYFNRFILFAYSQNINPFDCDAKCVAKFLLNCVAVLNRASVVFERRSLLNDVVKSIESLQKKTFENVGPKLSESPEVVELLELVESVDCGFDSKIGSNCHREEVFELTPNCKYLKYVLELFQPTALPHPWKQVIQVGE